LPLHLATPIRRLASARQVCALTALAALMITGSTANARPHQRAKHSHPRAKKYVMPEVNLPDMGILSDEVPEDGEKYELKLTRKSGEDLDVIYRVGDAYIPGAIDDLSQFLRDSHNEEVKSYDPRVFDLLYTMLRKVNRPSSPIEVLCGYRTQETNDALRATHTTNAAKHSQHIEATAVDIRVPGIPAAQLRDAALSLGAGGVGYYPKGQFIHVDTGDVRKWSFVRRRATHAHVRRTAHPHAAKHRHK